MQLYKQLANQLMYYALSIEDKNIRKTYIDFAKKWQVRRNREIILRDAQTKLCFSNLNMTYHKKQRKDKKEYEEAKARIKSLDTIIENYMKTMYSVKF